MGASLQLSTALESSSLEERKEQQGAIFWQLEQCYGKRGPPSLSLEM